MASRAPLWCGRSPCRRGSSRPRTTAGPRGRSCSRSPSSACSCRSGSSIAGSRVSTRGAWRSPPCSSPWSPPSAHGSSLAKGSRPRSGSAPVYCSWESAGCSGKREEEARSLGLARLHDHDQDDEHEDAADRELGPWTRVLVEDIDEIVSDVAQHRLGLVPEVIEEVHDGLHHGWDLSALGDRGLRGQVLH